MSFVEASKGFVKTAIFEKVLQARALMYTAESLPLHWIDSLIAKTDVGEITPELQKAVISEIRSLLARDAKNFSQGIYPQSLIVQPPSRQHILNLSEVYIDSIRAAFKRKNKKSKVFSAQVKKELEKYPEYYRRNFHFQTDGYLSEASARRYGLQVELLFRGMAAPMRRALLPPMVAWKPIQRILEVGCGTGVTTAMLAQTFPQARITAVDMSPHYIQFAKRNCQKYSNIDFMVGNAEDLPFVDGHFDASVSVFLLHELPKDVRLQVIQETQRVCEPEGFWGFVDSLQVGDIPEFDGFLQAFPINFHEPFFKDYVSRPIRKMMDSHRPFQEEFHFLAKMFCRKRVEVLPQREPA